MTINVGNGGSDYNVLYFAASNSTLTLAASATLNVNTAGYVQFYALGNDDTVVNQGVIDVTSGGLYLNNSGYAGAAFTNSGTITAGG